MVTVKEFPNILIGVLIDFRELQMTSFELKFEEIEKRFNSISTYCDDGNTVSGDGYWRHWCYSILVWKLKSN